MANKSKRCGFRACETRDVWNGFTAQLIQEKVGEGRGDAQLAGLLIKHVLHGFEGLQIIEQGRLDAVDRFKKEFL